MKIATKPHEAFTIIDRLTLGDVVVGRQPTTPTRMTLSAPTQSSRVSIGAQKGTDLLEVEAGITAQTDLHEHVHVGGPARVVNPDANDPLTPQTRNLVSNGTPSRLDPHTTTGDDLGLWNATFRERLRGDTADALNGHNVYTTGANLQYSVGDARVVATSGNALLRSRSTDDKTWVGVYSDHGEGHFYAKKDIWLGTKECFHIGAVATDLPQPSDQYKYAESIASNPNNNAWVTQCFSIVNTVAGAATSILGLILTVHHAFKVKFEAMPDFKVFAPLPSIGIKAALSVASLIAKGADLIAGISGWEQSVNIYAEKDVNVIAGFAANIYANTNASINGLINASVCGLTAGLSGALYSTVSSSH
jgi:hypothetical protein